ncbi:MAG: ketopantoate reductase family protein [Betaproteobacteria bacterium]
MAFDHVVVLGAGAIGSVYAAKLSDAIDVTIVAREAHVGAILRAGLRLTGLEERTVGVRAVTALEQVEPRTLVLLTTKVNGNRAAIGSIAAGLRDDTVVLCVQNGLDGEVIVKDEIARRHAGCQAAVLRAVTQCGAIFLEPGLVDLKVAGETILEPHGRSREIVDLLTAAGLPARVSDRIAVEIWRKLIFNCVINPITSIAGTEVGGIANPQLDPLKRLVVDECVKVAHAVGVEFDEDLVRAVGEIYGPSRNVASMRQDLLRGRPTEIAYMNGAVVALGRRLGMECPVNSALVAMIRAMEGKIAG